MRRTAVADTRRGLGGHLTRGKGGEELRSRLEVRHHGLKGSKYDHSKLILFENRKLMVPQEEGGVQWEQYSAKLFSRARRLRPVGCAVCVCLGLRATLQAEILQSVWVLWCCDVQFARACAKRGRGRAVARLLAQFGSQIDERVLSKGVRRSIARISPENEGKNESQLSTEILGRPDRALPVPLSPSGTCWARVQDLKVADATICCVGLLGWMREGQGQRGGRTRRAGFAVDVAPMATTISGRAAPRGRAVPSIPGRKDSKHTHSHNLHPDPRRSGAASARLLAQQASYI